MTPGRPLAASLATAVMMFGCSYEGDGEFVDHGITASHQRYVLDLGPVDLTRQARHEYKMANLPNDQFTFGLRLTGTNWDQKSVQAKVKLVLTNERNEVVFEVAESVSNWVWSGTPPNDPVFVYLRGESKETRSNDGGTRFEQVGVGPDGGWGTYAAIRRRGDYRLAFENLVPDTNAKTMSAHLMAVGGGWK